MKPAQLRCITAIESQEKEDCLGEISEGGSNWKVERERRRVPRASCPCAPRSRPTRHCQCAQGANHIMSIQVNQRWVGHQIDKKKGHSRERQREKGGAGRRGITRPRAALWMKYWALPIMQSIPAMIPRGSAASNHTSAMSSLPLLPLLLGRQQADADANFPGRKE